jgi:AcrR family transcriptional regulator
MPRYLTEQDIADFRAELCKVATERFARFGYEGVTMRQLAEALGCSPKTPYRYFKDKADILATVRAQAFGKFADTLEKATTGVTDTAERGRLTGEAYLAFALKNPHAYRIMFEIDAPVDEKHPELGPQADRAARYITRGAEEMATSGVIDVDPKLFGWSMWAAIASSCFTSRECSHGPDYKTPSNFLGLTMLKAGARIGQGGKERKNDGGDNGGRALPELGRHPGQCRAPAAASQASVWARTLRR